VGERGRCYTVVSQHHVRLFHSCDSQDNRQVRKRTVNLRFCRVHAFIALRFPLHIRFRRLSVITNQQNERIR